MPKLLDDVKVIVLERSLRPDSTDDSGESGPEVKNDTVGLDAPTIKFSEKLFRYFPAIEPGDRFNIEDSSLDSISE